MPPQNTHTLYTHYTQKVLIVWLLSCSQIIILSLTLRCHLSRMLLHQQQPHIICLSTPLIITVTFFHPGLALYPSFLSFSWDLPFQEENWLLKSLAVKCFNSCCQDLFCSVFPALWGLPSLSLAGKHNLHSCSLYACCLKAHTLPGYQAQFIGTEVRRPFLSCLGFSTMHDTSRAER